MAEHQAAGNTVAETDKVFAGSIPQIYDRYLVPLIFEPYAGDLAERLAERAPARILELAAGTGAATRAMAAALRSEIVATDLNPAMIQRAQAIGTARPVRWQEADAMQLPFEDGAFDAVVCQFGAMFFPDKVRAFAEARRVLAPGGVFLFNVWDRIEENDFADVVTRALAGIFPEDPPRFLARTPHGYHERARVAADLSQAGFTTARLETLAARSIAPSFRDPAIAYCQGTPLRNEIESRRRVTLEEATDVAAQALGDRFGHGAVDGKVQAHVAWAQR